MFSTLRQGASIYILDKGENPQLKIGRVESISTPQPRIAVPNYTGMAFNNDTVIDIKVKTNDDGSILDFQKIPTGLSVATIGNIIISDSREDILTEVNNFMLSSKQILDNKEYYKRAVEACDQMLIQLNPDYAKDKERDSTIESMKTEMAEIRSEFRGAMAEIKSLLSLYAPSPGVGQK